MLPACVAVKYVREKLNSTVGVSADFVFRRWLQICVEDESRSYRTPKKGKKQELYFGIWIFCMHPEIACQNDAW